MHAIFVQRNATLLLLLSLVIGLHYKPTAAGPATINDKWNLKQLETIEKYMNNWSDPCVDFFSYACGNWPRHHEQERYSDITGYIDHMTNKKLVTVLKSPIPLKYENSSAYEKLWQQFRSCKAERNVLLKRYLQLVKPAPNLEWPLLERRRSSTRRFGTRFNWLLTVAHLRRYGLNNVLLEHMVLPTHSNGSKYMLDIDMPNLESNQAKLPSRVKLFGLLKMLDVRNAVALEWAQKLSKFESNLVGLANLVKDSDGRLYEMTLGDLEETFPNMPWRNYFEIIMEHPVADNFTIQFRNWAYFEALQAWLDETNPTLICNYIMMKFLYYVLVDRTASRDSIECVIDLRSKMDIAVSYLYRDMYFDQPHYAERIKTDVLHIFGVLQLGFRRQLFENSLNLNSSQVALLKEKLLNVKLIIDNLPQNADLDYIDTYYRDLQLENRNYHANQLALMRFRERKEHDKLHMSDIELANAPENIDSGSARSCSPYYIMHRNLIVVPSSVLQPPVYQPDQHPLLKISLLGFLLAHELVHAFDATSLSYNHQGEFTELGQSIKNTKGYESGVQCMQAGQPTESIDERIADIVGIRLAYDVILRNVNKSRRNDDVRRFTEWPAKKLFFLNFAQFFCGNLKFEFEDHDDDNVRLKVTLKNFKEFGEAFECEEGEDMYSTNEDVCRLW